MKRLIIAEKPHLARFVLSCINEKFVPMKVNNSQGANYYESDNYIITNCFGHLFEAYDIEDYTKNTEASWNLDILPFYPENNQFHYKLKTTKDKAGSKVTDPGIKLQYKVISELVNRADVKDIIHCGDADREGEVIVRHPLRNCNTNNKPIYRLWFNEETSDAFNKSFYNLLPDNNYDNLANEGEVRSKADWMYGINLTRYLTLKAAMPKGKPLRAGRVLCAMVNEIYNRDMEIQNFVPEDYFAVISDMETNGNKIHLRSKQTFKIDEENKAKALADKYNSIGASVIDVKSEKKAVSPGKLYSLTSFQTHMNKKFGMSLTESMKALQSVYEQGYVTYPRTNTEYLGTSEKDEVKARIDVFTKQGYNLKFRDAKAIFDDSKIDGHSALCPTKKIPTDKLKDNELKVYEEIRNRFLAVFCAEPCITNKTQITIQCADENFILTGSVLIQNGFLNYDYQEPKETVLPDLKIGDIVKVSFKTKKEQTKPPSHYTVTSFASFLESPFKTEKTTEEERYEALMKGLEIGTVATRTQIIENIIHCGYVKVSNNSYSIEPLGIYFVELMKKLNIDMSKEKTVETSVILKKVNHGELTQEQAIEMVKNDVNDMFIGKDMQISSIADENISVDKNSEPIGECILCDGKVYPTSYGFKCENNDKDNPSSCPIILFTEDKYIKMVTGKKLTAANATSVLKKGYFISKAKTKSGIEYDIMLRLQLNDNNHPEWKQKKDIGKCPVCGKNVNITPFGYTCENNERNGGDCFFTLFKNDKFINTVTKKELQINQVLNLLNKQSITVQAEKKDGSGKYPLILSLNIDRVNKKITWVSTYKNR